MTKNAIIISCYALFILIGGIIGHLAAQSLASLIASSLFAILLLISSTLMVKGKKRVGYYLATLLTTLLFAFFTYRFFLTLKFMPGGMMACISALLLFYLVFQRKEAVSLS